MGLRVADKKDSQEICFVTSGHHGDFVGKDVGRQLTFRGTLSRRTERWWESMSESENFTIGQRKGLGVALRTPHYVVRIDRDSRQVVLGSHEELGRSSLTADRTNWLIDPVPISFRCQAQIRYNSAPQDATATLTMADGEEQLQIDFDQPVHGIAPGQAVVCYEGDMVIGGGWIL